MKIIKLLITMSVINALLVLGAVKYSPVPSASAVPSATIKSVVKPAVRPAGATQQTPAPKTKAPTVAPTPASSVTHPTKNSGCIIQIDGVRYEVSSLQRTHSGGNVFTCGSDMSAIFWGRYNQKILQMMQRYRI